MKIIKILMAAIVVIALATNVGATYLLTEYNPPLVIVGQMYDLGTQVKYYYNIYDEMNDSYINVTANNYIGYTATWISAILPETLYFWSFKLEPVGSGTVVSQTGELQKKRKSVSCIDAG